MKKYQTMDGNTAAAYISYAFTDVAAIYPITPSSPMAEMVDEWAVQGKKNIFGQTVDVTELQSEAGAAAAVHGSLKAGALTTTYTASQGLLLMLPNMYKIAGEQLPGVFHVASRTIATSALSIFGDHSDVMATRQTGCAMLAEGSVQEVMDLSAVAHLAAMEGQLPFINFFDGFRTSHEIQKIAVLDYEDLKTLYPMEAYHQFKAEKMHPYHPTVSGTAQNPDIHFQQRELVNTSYNNLPHIVKKYMDKINSLQGTDYDLINYYGDEDATEVIIAMGSVTSTLKQTVDYLNQQGRKVGMMAIHLYRPFPIDTLKEKLPKTVQKIAVLDRTKEPGSEGEPLLQDVRSALYGHSEALIAGGRYGISSKDVTPNQLIAVYDYLQNLTEIPAESFTVGIVDDITHLSLPLGENIDLTPKETYQALFYGFGSDGTVGANKQAIKIIGQNTDQYVQGYFSYDSKKSGGLTISHLRMGPKPIDSTYLIQKSQFVACHNASYLHRYDMLNTLEDGGIFVLNTQWNKEEILTHLPKKVKKVIAKKHAQFYVIDAFAVSQKMGLGRRINTIMEKVFFALSQVVPEDVYEKEMKVMIHQAYSKKSMDIVEKNYRAVDSALDDLEKVDYPVDEWQAINLQPKEAKETSYAVNIAQTILEEKGNDLTLSEMAAFNMTKGEIPLGTSAIEKCGVALSTPVWDETKCTQCNECAFVCPHAAIRPIVIDDVEKELAPEGFITRDMRGQDGLYYRIQVSVEDCTGCELCTKRCPADALHMEPYVKTKDEAINWAFAMTVKEKTFPGKISVEKSQYHQPLLEFSGACPGCGETPYVKLLTQLFGNRLMIANATGCSSIWGASSPTTPYTVNAQGHGPAWSNSLLEDAAEYGYGMYLAQQKAREAISLKLVQLKQDVALLEEQKSVINDWLEYQDDGAGTEARAQALVDVLKSLANSSEIARELLRDQDALIKTSQWMIGGDGWAYDIGYGGLDHILSTGADVNLLVLDNEVYANTGGQTSKATPTAAIAKFSAGGKREMKKDLGQLALTYPNVYVAQVSANSHPAQTLKAIEEAEAHKGPSLIIAYTPCIAHGLKGGMSNAIKEAEEAVKSGYWSLYRYQPETQKMYLDYKRPDFSQIRPFLMTQSRFASLEKIEPAIANDLYQKIEDDAIRRFFVYAQKAGLEEKLKAKLMLEQEVNVEENEADAKVRRQKEREARRKAREARRKSKE